MINYRRKHNATRIILCSTVIIYTRIISSSSYNNNICTFKCFPSSTQYYANHSGIRTPDTLYINGHNINILLYVMYDRDRLRISNYPSGIFYNNSVFLLPIHFNGGTDKNDNNI